MSSGLQVMYPLFLPDVNETWISSLYFWKIPSHQI